MMNYKPQRIYFEPDALEYPVGKRIYERAKHEKIPILKTTSHNQVRGLPGDTPKEAFAQAKQTLVVGVRRTLKFQTSKPSADYALPLVTGCPGHCQYCYLQTTLGPKPYVRVYVNLDEILDAARKYIEKKAPGERTMFEGSCVSDPIPLEPYTDALATSIKYFSMQERGYFRFVTKYGEIDSLLDIDHRQHTEIRFSLNAETPVRLYEHAVGSIRKRIEGAKKVFEAGYPLGFLIAPIFIYDGWQKEYGELIRQVDEHFRGVKGLSFELITHRYTPKAKNLILERYPDTTLPMEDEERKWKFGQFGYGKYLYTKEQIAEVRSYFEETLHQVLDQPIIKYTI